MAIAVKRALDEFLMENGFAVRSHNNKTHFTFGHAYVHPEITGEVYPIAFFQKGRDWYCYIHGIRTLQIPTPHELVIVLEQLKSLGVK